MSELQKFSKGYLEKFHEPRLISGYSGKVCTDACFMMLEEIPSEDYRVTIKGYNEVLNLDDIENENDFYVDYTNNYIYFHKSKMGQTITVDDYYGIGLNFIGASRIIVRSNVTEDVIQTLEDLIEQAKLCLEAITTLGGATEVIEQLKEDTETGRKVDEQLQGTIKSGSATIQAIKDTGNKSFVVNKTDWTSTTNGYKYTLTHNLQSINLHVSMIDLTDNMAYPSQYKTINVNTIEIYAMEKIKANVVISARYYNGIGVNVGDKIVQEVVDARGGMTSLGDKIRDMDSSLEDIVNDKENRKCLYIKDYAKETTDITSILPQVLNLCYSNNYNLDLTGNWSITSTISITSPIKIHNGNLTIPSYESDGTNDFFVFSIESDNVELLNINATSSNDKIPRLNKRNSQNNGLGSNVYLVKSDGYNNITLDNCHSNYMSLASFENGENILINNPILKMFEMGFYFYNCNNIKINNIICQESTDVNSIYYHLIYSIESDNFDIDGIKITSNGTSDFFVNDILHFYNPSSTATAKGNNINVKNVYINGNFNRVAQVNLHENVIFDNINGTVRTHVMLVNRDIKNIQLNNSNITVTIKEKDKGIIYSSDFDAENEIICNNTIFTITSNDGGGVLATSNVEYNNCIFKTSETFSIAKSLNTGYVKCNGCKFITSLDIKDMFNGDTGIYEYFNCEFICNNKSEYINYNFSETINIKIINSFFTCNKKIFNTSIVNHNAIVHNSIGFVNGTVVKYTYPTV